MNDPLLSQDGTTEGSWQLLFQQEVPSASAPDAPFGEALTYALGPLQVTPELSERVKTSIQEAVVQAFRQTAGERGERRVLLQVYIPPEVESQRRSNQNWGYFWIKKTGEGPVAGSSGEHRIEVYLYLDG